MKIQHFGEASLARHFLKEDFYKLPDLSIDEYRHSILQDAADFADRLLVQKTDLITFSWKGKDYYSVPKLSHKLVFRACAAHLRSALNVRGKSRSQIAREIKSFAAEGTPYKVHKFDIKSFFEGIQIEQLENKIEDVRGLSRHTKKLLCRGMHYFHVEKGCCVPRGIETSGILSDLYLREFDEIIRRDEGVFFYSRFVDDILIFTDKGLDSDAFKKRIGERLPEGLGLNDKKYDSKTVPERKKAGDLYIGKELAIFNYLGFEFRVIDTPLPIKKVNGQLVEDGGRAKYQFREVRVDLSGNKVKRTKEKICKSFYSYYKNKNYELLKDRLRFLTSNREMVKKDDSVIIPIGVYYNSSACDYPSTKLSHLDSFMRYLLSGSNDRLPKLYSGLFSRQERSELLKFSFSYGFRHRVHRRFSYNRMAEIVKVWK